MKTITFYSYKGGVGRSLALSNIATRLADVGKKVCLLDFDLEAPGLHLKFKNQINRNLIQKGIVEYLHDYQELNFLPNNLEKYLIDVKYTSKLKGFIKLIPAGNVYGNDYWKHLSSINWKEMFYSDVSDGVKLLLHLKESILKEIKPDFLLIDSRTGITDMSGIAMTLLANSVVILAANNDENIDGSADVIKSLLSPENNLTGSIPDIHFVLSRIPYYSNPEEKHKEVRIINRAINKVNKKQHLIDDLMVIHSDRNLEEEEKFMISGYSSNHKKSDSVPIEEDYLNLFESLTANVLKQDEIERFNNLRDAELLIEEANSSSDSAVKISKLKKALELNENSHEAQSILAQVYFELKSYEKALERSELAISLEKDILEYHFDKAHTLLELNRIEESKEICEDIIEKQEHHYGALILLGYIHYDRKDYKKALFYNSKIIDFYPDISSGYNAVGNAYRVLGEYDKAFNFIYKALEINPKDAYATGSLAEIYSQIGNDYEFYKNLQLSFVFGMTDEQFQKIFEQEKDIYGKYVNEEKFIRLLKNYRIKLKL